MRLGTVWNHCVLIKYQGELGGFPQRLEDKIRIKLQEHQQTFPRATNYNIWYDLESETCFSGAQFKNGPAGKDDHFTDDKDLFLGGKWGRSFVKETVKGNEVFADQEFIYDEEYIYSRTASFDRYKGKSVLIICGGPSTKAVKWQNIGYDYLWTCNKFYLNPEICECHVDLVVLARDVELLGNHSLADYLQKHSTTRVVFQLDRGNGINAWKDANTFSEYYPERVFFYHTRYQSRIGIGSRLLCFAALLGFKDIYFVGLDGMTKVGPRHAFEPDKENPHWYKVYGDGLQKKQFVVLWDYLFGLKEKYEFNLFNLGEGHPDNVSSNISEQECPLPEDIKRIIYSENSLLQHYVDRLEADRTAVKNVLPTLDDTLKDKNQALRRSTAYTLSTIPAANQEVSALIAAMTDEHKIVRRSVAYAIGIIKPTARQVIPALLAGIKDDDETTQWFAAAALQKIGTDTNQIVDNLINLLKDENEMVRLYAACTLGKIGKRELLAQDNNRWLKIIRTIPLLRRIIPLSHNVSKAVVPALIDTLTDTADQTRLAAVTALGDFGLDGTEAVPALIAILRDENKTLPWVAAKALGSIGKGAVPALIDALTDKDERVRRFAAKSLGTIGLDAKEAMPALIQALKDDDLTVRGAATASLGKIGMRCSEAISSLADMLKDQSETIRLNAAYALEKIGCDPRKILSGLIAILGDKDVRLRWYASNALGNIGPDAKEAVPALIAALSEENEDVRLSVANALGNIGPDAKEAVSALTHVMTDISSTVRGAVASALGKIGPDAKEAVPALIDALTDSSVSVQRLVTHALGKIGPDSPETMLDLLEKPISPDELEGVRTFFHDTSWEKESKNHSGNTVYLATINANSMELLPALIDALRNQNKGIRRAAAYGLGLIGPGAKEAVPALIAMLKTDDEKGRWAAAYSLGNIKESAVPALIVALNDNNTMCRRAAAYALALIGPTAKEAVPALITTLKNEDEKVQGGAAHALGSIGPAALEAVPALTLALQSKIPMVQDAAATALENISS